MIDKKIVDCVLGHPHVGQHLSSKTVLRRMRDEKWRNRCVLCGRETDRKDFNNICCEDLYVCVFCFFAGDFDIREVVKEFESEKKTGVSKNERG